MGQQRTYIFGARRQSGPLAGLRAGQLACLAVGVIGALGLLRLGASLGGLAAAVAWAGGWAAAAFVPIGGRTLQQWAPVLVRWAWRRATGRHRWESATPLLGHDHHGRAQLDVPDVLVGLEILAAPAGRTGQTVGLVADRRELTYTALLAVDGQPLDLADQAERDRRLAGWGGLLAGIAQSSAPIHRLQWVHRSVPDGGDALGRWLADHRRVDRDDPSLASYLELIDGAAPASTAHETLLAISLSAVRAHRQVKAAGGGDAGAAAVLLREVASIRRHLARSEVTVRGALPPRAVAFALRCAADPGARRQAARRQAAGAPDGVDPASAAPLTTETTLTAYRTDSAWHTTYWIAEWPRTPVRAGWVDPLLTTQATCTVGLIMQPVDPATATRQVERQHVAALDDRELRRRAGFVDTARRRTQREAVLRREEELAAGHGAYRYAGFVTVTAGSRTDLEVACGEVEQAAARAHLALRREDGRHDEAWTWTLPICRVPLERG